MQFYTFYKSPIGILKICATEKGICAIQFSSKRQISTKEQPHFHLNAAKYYLDAFFAKKNPKCELPLDLNGTTFQLNVWTLLQTIPFGETRTYKEIATIIRNSKAARAVGRANHSNPIPIIIPCHRVIGTNGKLIGYAGGLAIKQKLLDFESTNSFSI